MIRLFTAIALPPEIGEPLILRQAGVEGARWRPREAFHVTLKFIGDVQETQAADLDEQLATIEAPALDLSLESVGYFGEGVDIHALWAGLAENPDLRRLAKANEAAARRAELKPEARRYTPHVTLAYLKRSPQAEVAAWIQANSLLRSPPFRIDRFGLYSSWRTESGSAYRLERDYPLVG
jgi:2'-5' RNA ligase